MQIVIEISEEKWRRVLNGTWCGSKEISNGVPLSRIFDSIRGELWMDGVNMTGEYQGVWVRFRDIESAFNKRLKADKEKQE